MENLNKIKKQELIEQIQALQLDYTYLINTLSNNYKEIREVIEENTINQLSENVKLVHLYSNNKLYNYLLVKFKKIDIRKKNTESLEKCTIENISFDEYSKIMLNKSWMPKSQKSIYTVIINGFKESIYIEIIKETIVISQARLIKLSW